MVRRNPKMARHPQLNRESSRNPVTPKEAVLQLIENHEVEISILVHENSTYFRSGHEIATNPEENTCSSSHWRQQWSTSS
jgi:hypothetical protein